jgi:hypothetical protein
MALDVMSWQRPNIGSRVTREGHARFWERPEVKFLRATRHAETCLTTQPWSAFERITDPCNPARSCSLGSVIPCSDSTEQSRVTRSTTCLLRRHPAAPVPLIRRRALLPFCRNQWAAMPSFSSTRTQGITSTVIQAPSMNFAARITTNALAVATAWIYRRMIGHESTLPPKLCHPKIKVLPHTGCAALPAPRPLPWRRSSDQFSKIGTSL